ncbi:MAG: arylsulfotransferase family protein, partial [Solirubrobacteraceae bacterium]
PSHTQSRAITVALDFKTHAAHLVSAYVHSSPPLLAASQGNMQTLPDGNTLVGFGAEPVISEYAKNGSPLFDAHLPYEMIFYRAYRFPWSGRPLTPPAAVASQNNVGQTIVYMSWNGATGVASWRVLAGTGASSLAAQTTVPLDGFETSTILPKRYGDVAVEALDAAGHVLGTSHAVAVTSYAAEYPVSGSSGRTDDQ